MNQQNIRRIAYVLNVFPKLSETFIAREIAEIKRRGIKVLILSIRLPKESLHHDIVRKAALIQETVYGRQQFDQALLDFKPDLIHAHFATEATAAGIQLSQTYKLPFTFTAHGYDIYRKPPADFHQRAALSDGLITVSEANRRYISDRFDLPKNTIALIPSGVDPALFQPLPDHIRGKLPLIVCVARLVPVKNLPLLLTACAILKAEGLKFRCAIVGEGRCREALEQMQVRFGLEKILLLAGAADESQVVNWWQQADIAVLSSLSEGMPVSLLEAAACAVPIVASDVGGISELVEDGLTGFLISSGEAPALAKHIRYLMMHPREATQMGQRARKRVAQNFSMTRQGDLLLERWGDILNRRAS